ncbi:MAG: GC-type dockerin domain-anchored protein [Phycisphaerales bacterium]
MRAEAWRCAAVAAGVVWGSAASGVEVRTLALSGQQAPGAPAGATFISGFGPPDVNASGQAAFTGILTGTGVDFTNSWGVYAGAAGAVAQAGRTGQALPGAPGVTLLNPLGPAWIADSGTTLFRTALTGASITADNDWAICASSGGSLSVMAREGDQAPGAPAGINYGVLDQFQLTPGGRVAFDCLLAGAGVSLANDGAVVAGAMAGATVIAREGDAAPGLAGVTLFNVGRGLTNDAGDVAYLATLAGSGVSGANDVALYLGTAGAVAPVLREGDALTGALAGTMVKGFTAAGLDDSGRVVQLITLDGTGVGSLNDTAIVGVTSGAVTSILREGGQAPGMGAGVSVAFLEIYVHPSGHVAFVGVLEGAGITAADDAVLYAGDGTTFAPVAREGDPAPGIPSALLGTYLQGVRVNAAGQAAFVAGLTGPGVTSSNNQALYLTDGAGNTELIARTGDPFDVDDTAGTDLRTPISIQFTVSSDTHHLRSSLGDGGDVVFTLFFSDGSMGVFGASLGSACPADVNGDGVLNLDDVNVFAAAFVGGNLIADVDGNGVLNLDDVNVFAASFIAGCP